MLKLSTSFLRHSRRWVYPLLTAAIALSVCVGQPLVSQALSLGDIIRLIPSGVQVIQLARLSDQQEVAIGKQMNDQTITRQFRLYRGAELNQYVNQIGQRLAAQSGRTQIPYTYQIVEDKSINAFATMGGFVYVTTGLMKAADNEAQLASVIGHETGHIVRRHLVNQLKEEATLQGIATLAKVNSNTIVNIGTTLALSRPHSRNAEFEADQAGLSMMGRAGYAQSAAPAFMSKLLNQSSTPTFLSTHPATADRVARLKQSVNPAMANGAGLDNVAYKSRIRSLS
jgi:predicted Zn-dependent protease